MKLLDALDAGNLLLRNLLDPVSAQDAATRNYVDNKVTGTFTTDATRMRFRGGYGGFGLAVNDVVTDANKLYVAVATSVPRVIGSVSGTLTGSASVNLTLPAGTASGDKVVVYIMSTVGPIDTPAGWGSPSSGSGGGQWQKWLTYTVTATDVTNGFVTFTETTNAGDLAISGQVIRYFGNFISGLGASSGLTTATQTPSTSGIVLEALAAPSVGTAKQSSLSGLVSTSSASTTTALGYLVYSANAVISLTWSFSGSTTNLKTDAALIIPPFALPTAALTEIGILSAGALQPANNLSDVASATTARSNLGLGPLATLASTAVLQAANNLSDLAFAATARSNLGLGTAATLASTAVLQPANNLSDVASAATARTNLGLGTAATLASTAVLQAANNLSDLGSVPAARSSLGLTISAITSNAVGASPGTLVVRDANGRAQVVDPSAGADIATKTYADTKIAINTATTKGDLIAGTGGSLIARVPVGGDGLLLTADSTAATGVAWKALTTTAVDSTRMKYRGAWSAGMALDVNDVVLNGGKLYVATTTAPSVVGGVIGTLSGPGSVNLTLPAGTQAGDLLVLAGFSDVGSLDTPSGWGTQATSSANGLTQSIRSHVVTTTDITNGFATFTQTSNAGAAALSGQVIHNGLLPGSGGIANGNGSTVTVPAYTPPLPGIVLEIFGALQAGTASQASLSGLVSADSTTTTSAMGYLTYRSGTLSGFTWSFTGSATNSARYILVQASLAFPSDVFTEIGVLSSGVLQPANNLSDVASAATARTNLGLGTAATLASTAVLQVANNLSDLASAATARTNLGLAAAATLSNANTLALRDASGRAQFVDPSTPQDAATKGYVDARSPTIVNATANATLAGSVGLSYVYVATVSGISLVLPDATNNTSLYTIKNGSAGTITITASVSPQTIDGTVGPITLNSWQSIDLVALGGVWYVI